MSVLIEIYTLENCPACENTKKMLAEKNINYQEYKVGVDVSREDLQDRYPDVVAVPLILVDGRRLNNAHELRLLVEG